MSSIPGEVLEEASSIASLLSGIKTYDSSNASENSPKANTIARQLVQVARNSLLDSDSLRYI